VAADLLSPSSISWRVNAERIVLLGWGRAILLQLAHPLIAAGVFEHSGFRASPLAAAGRLRHTVRAMLGLTFGSEAERGQALDGIRAIHRRVNGRLTETVGPWQAGTPYSAEDPALVLWVHATILESMLVAYETLVQPVTEAERDAYCEEAAWVAVALRARPEDVPRDWAAMQGYIADVHASGSLAIGSQAHELASAVLSPAGTWPVAPATWTNGLVTAGLLPPAIRTRYGLPWSPSRERAFATTVAALRLARRGFPRVAAHWPQARRRTPPQAR
jgi:uncharacterized protein (DUF2236 family)